VLHFCIFISLFFSFFLFFFFLLSNQLL
jgi:hypothetical protein